MMATLPRDEIWFALRWRRLWAVRREGRIAVALYFGAVVLSALLGFGAMALAGVVSGIAVFAACFGLAFWCFTGVQRRHTERSVGYDDYFGASKGASDDRR